MFPVSCPIKQRHAHIKKFLDTDDATISILLAAADFERTLKRGILGLGSSPTKDIKDKAFGKTFHGVEKFKQVWKAEVEPQYQTKLANGVVKNWDTFIKAYSCRHKIIHGVTGRMSNDFASATARCLLDASLQVHTFAANHGVPLDARIVRLAAR